MGAQRTNEGSGRHKRGPAAEALLALVIERPSYVYELWKRFDERFGQLYPLSKGRIYQLMNMMARQGLVERMDGDAPSLGRQPKPRYRATPAGARAHREWLVRSIQDDPRREELLRRLLATGVRDARQMLRIVDLYEAALLTDMGRKPSLVGYRGEAPAAPELRERLINEERRLAREAALKFIAYARTLIDSELEGRGA